MTTVAPAFGHGDAQRVAEHVRARLGAVAPRAAVVLGSGLGGLADRVDSPRALAYSELPGFPESTVAGHAGLLIAGELEGVPVVAFAGRFHLYEGHDARLAAFPARLAHALGAKTLIVSNAAGGLNRSFVPGDVMLIRDHLNLTFRNPLFGATEPGDVRFPDMSSPYDDGLCALARQVAAEQGTSLREGVYAALLGPSYETPAEVRMLERLGAQAVGMSTVPEVIAARAIGLRVLGFSCITNLACGLSNTPVTHAEVLETTARTAARFERLVAGVVGRLKARPPDC